MRLGARGRGDYLSGRPPWVHSETILLAQGEPGMVPLHNNGKLKFAIARNYWDDSLTDLSVKHDFFFISNLILSNQCHLCAQGYLIPVATPFLHKLRLWHCFIT